MMTAKLPIWRTIKDVYGFILDHPGELARIGWLPLVLLVALSLAFGTYNAGPGDAADILADLSISRELLVTILQGAIATVMLVACHRLVMKKYVTVAPETSGGRAASRRTGIYFMQLLALSVLLLVVFSLAFLVAVVVLHGINYFVFDSNVAEGILTEETTSITLGYVAAGIGLLPAFYVTFRLALALPATAVDRRGHFEKAWESSADNGWRMVAVTMLAILPIELINFALTSAARSANGTMLFYPLVLLACLGILLLMAALGIVLSKCYAATMHAPQQAAPHGRLVPAAG